MAMDQWKMIEARHEREEEANRKLFRYIVAVISIIVTVLAGMEIVTSCLCGG